MVFFKLLTHSSYEGLPIESLFFNFLPFIFLPFMRNDDTNNARLDKERNKKQKLKIEENNKINLKGNLKDKAETKEKERE